MISRSRRPGVLLAAVVLAIACDASAPDLTGTWSGAIERTCGGSVTLTIVESPAGVITGSANSVSPPSCGFFSVNYLVSGEHNHPQVVLMFEPVPGQNGPTFGISGTVRGADTIIGVSDGDAVTLARQRSP
jgi:hypothetical protein